MPQTFAHHYADGFVITNASNTGWEPVFYARLYRERKSFPPEWNYGNKKASPVSIFITSKWRTKTRHKNKLWYSCDVRYKYSEN